MKNTIVITVTCPMCGAQSPLVVVEDIWVAAGRNSVAYCVECLQHDPSNMYHEHMQFEDLTKDECPVLTQDDLEKIDAMIRQEKTGILN